MGELGAHSPFIALLHCVEESLVFDEGAADAAEDIRMNAAMIVYGHEHHDSGAGIFERRICKDIIPAGGTAHKYSL